MPRLRVEHAAHCAPLERGNLNASHSIHMSIRWIEEFDADTSWMLLVDRIIPSRDNGMLRMDLSLCAALDCPVDPVFKKRPAITCTNSEHECNCFVHRVVRGAVVVYAASAPTALSYTNSKPKRYNQSEALNELSNYKLRRL